MDRSDQPTEFRGAIRGRQSRATAYVVIGGVALVVGLGLLARLSGDSPAPAPLPSASAPVAAASPSPRPSRVPTPRPSSSPAPARTPEPTPEPTPVPTLAPAAAPSTTEELSPSGALVADTGDPALGGLVPDVDGTVWATRAGGLVNLDLRTGRTREWTIVDDPIFASASPAASRRGGVWLINPDAIRLFDGERFRVVIETPTQLWTIVEAPDGSLWAQTEPYGLIRWKDGTWTSDPPGRPSRGAANLVVDRDGRLWAANYDVAPMSGSWSARGISVWDGMAWATYAPEDLPTFTSFDPPGLIAGLDGSVWAAIGSELARFDGHGWTAIRPEGIVRYNEYLNAVDVDGRLWFARDGCETCGVAIDALDGSALTSYGSADGLPGGDVVPWGWASVVAGPGYVLASTEAGLYRLAGQRWRRVEMTPATGTSPAAIVRPGRIATLAAASGKELWAATQPDPNTGQEAGLFRFDGAAWHRERLPVETVVRQLTIAPDGALWAATDAGPMVRRRGAWIDLGDIVENVVPRRRAGGGPGCGGALSFADDGIVYYVGIRSANRVVALLPSGSTWSASLHSAPRVEPECPTEMAVTADGTVWLLQWGWGTILSRSAGDPWETVRLPVAGNPSTQVDPSAIAVGRDGSLWAVASIWHGSTNTGSSNLLQLVDNEWVSRGVGAGLDSVRSLSIMADGSLIVAGNGVARFDGRQWHRWLQNVWLDRVSVAPDGSVWVAGPNVYRLPAGMP